MPCESVVKPGTHTTVFRDRDGVHLGWLSSECGDDYERQVFAVLRGRTMGYSCVMGDGNCISTDFSTVGELVDFLSARGCW